VGWQDLLIIYISTLTPWTQEPTNGKLLEHSLLLSSFNHHSHMYSSGPHQQHLSKPP